jgi:maleylacetoacetate isomerase/maleylpyruvate isomerase
MKLHNYFRSSASYRVRIALNLKGLAYDYLPVHLVKGDQFTDGFRALSPDGIVPVLETDGARLTESLAIIEYLEDTHPEPPLLPKDAIGRARVRAIALAIACEIHPLNNLRVLGYLTGKLGLDEDKKNAWYKTWVESGLTAVERQLAQSKATGKFCHGDKPGLADTFLIPQIFNAKRFNCRTDNLPTAMRIYDACMTLPAFDKAQPSKQPDAE